jgi:hypothetical protein
MVVKNCLIKMKIEITYQIYKLSAEVLDERKDKRILIGVLLYTNMFEVVFIFSSKTAQA